MDNKKEPTDMVVNPEGKKRAGRKPMTEAEKEAAAKVRAEEKAKAVETRCVPAHLRFADRFPHSFANMVPMPPRWR